MFLNSIDPGSTVDLSHLEAAWKKAAELICFITPTDKRQEITYVKVPVGNGKRSLIEEAPKEIREKFARNPESVPQEWFSITVVN